MSAPRIVLDGDELRRIARLTMRSRGPELDERARLINNVADLLDGTGNLDALIVASALEAVAADLMKRFVVKVRGTETLQ